jgi:hypothetical protein
MGEAGREGKKITRHNRDGHTGHEPLPVHKFNGNSDRERLGDKFQYYFLHLPFHYSERCHHAEQSKDHPSEGLSHILLLTC